MIPTLNLKAIPSRQRPHAKRLIESAKSNTDVCKRHRILWRAYAEIEPVKLKGATRKQKKFIYLRVELQHKHSDVFQLTMFRRYQDEREECLGSMTLTDCKLETDNLFKCPMIPTMSNYHCHI